MELFVGRRSESEKTWPPMVPLSIEEGSRNLLAVSLASREGEERRRVGIIVS